MAPNNSSSSANPKANEQPDFNMVNANRSFGTVQRQMPPNEARIILETKVNNHALRQEQLRKQRARAFLVAAVERARARCDEQMAQVAQRDIEAEIQPDELFYGMMDSGRLVGTRAEEETADNHLDSGFTEAQEEAFGDEAQLQQEDAGEGLEAGDGSDLSEGEWDANSQALAESFASLDSYELSTNFLWDIPEEGQEFRETRGDEDDSTAFDECRDFGLLSEEHTANESNNHLDGIESRQEVQESQEA
ncbi:hypothetical protein BDP81DRAFT_444782 [Colletotrichum phormii]|uniref:Uncharacterized protein n=1 Tax=Colletotrichum phormii TaxID=359342 RepID=A0AAJ0A514_9PEZI|nr:uncharacterized protein BDP81DRAFT_444782 [Colletotrichum phormii]KAK1656219.1 hypothetical protein BDP81DRAFT_444782 [Colletotrichum phormii]